MGWQGEGLAGERAGPGLPGMLLGILNGVCLGLFCAVALGAMAWAAGSRVREYSLAVVVVGFTVIRVGLDVIPRLAILFVIAVVVDLTIRWWRSRR